MGRRRRIGGSRTYDIVPLLSGDERDYLVRSNGDQVKLENLKGKTLGLYFSMSSCTSGGFFPELTETYHCLLSQSKPFEVICIPCDEDEESFISYFSQMPWLSVPFPDSMAIQRLRYTFKISCIPTFIMIDVNGHVVHQNDAYKLVTEHGPDGYPFTAERLAELKEILEAQKGNQTIRSLLVSKDHDYVLSSQGDKVPVAELEGKYVGLYFDASNSGTCEEFSPILSEMHEKLNQNGESFEIVTVILDTEESSFSDMVAKLPFLSIPFKDKRIKKLERYFKDTSQPGLAIIGPDGKTLSTDCIDAIEEHGVEALAGFPFTPEKMAILEGKTRSILEQQTLESLLVRGELDYVVGKDNLKIPVSDLAGRTIILYFSRDWCRSDFDLLPKLIKEYNKIKSKYYDSFETIFVSSDEDQESYDNFYSSMPWLAIPFGDPRKSFLKRIFKIRGEESLVVIGPSGETVAKESVSTQLMVHGADAYPFTDERIKELKDEMDDKAKGWPEKMKHELHDEHDHELVLTKSESICFTCCGCGEWGGDWSYRCHQCCFRLLPTYACIEEGKWV